MTHLDTKGPARTNAQQSRPTGFLSKTRRLARSFGRNEGGTAILEFAIISTPFLLMIFATMEVGVHYFAERSMQKGVDRVARKLRTGEMPPTTTIQQFRNALCQEAQVGMLSLFDCQKFAIDIQEVDEFTSPQTPLDSNDRLQVAALGFNPAGPGELNMVRVFYEWPAFLNWARFDANNAALDVPRWSADDRLFTAVSMFRNEPFPDASPPPTTAPAS